jgi:hypothetical protein
VLAPVRATVPGGHGAPLALVRCCAPADAASVAPRMMITLGARHRAEWDRVLVVMCIVPSGLLPCWSPRGLVGGWGAPPRHLVAALDSAPRTTVIVEGDGRGAQCACP